MRVEKSSMKVLIREDGTKSGIWLPLEKKRYAETTSVDEL